MINSFSKTKDKVKFLLEKYPETRDDDDKMIWQYILFDAGSNYLKTLNGYDFLIELYNGKYTSPDIITRARRKLQEQYPELRGKTYESRKNLAHETKVNIKNL